MRCDNCGGKISLEMAFCPYCGKENVHATQHIRDMQEYRQDYEETKTDVQERAHRFTGTTVRVIVIALLGIMIVLLLVLGGNVYSLKRKLVTARTERNAESVMSQMDIYLEEEDFIAFTVFCEENYIDTFETVFEKYMPVERAASYYRYLYSQLMRIVVPPEYLEMEEAVKDLEECLDQFYRALDKSEYEYYENIDWELNEKSLSAMEKKVNLLLETYCGLTREEAEALKTMTSAKRAMMLEEAILND